MATNEQEDKNKESKKLHKLLEQYQEADLNDRTVFSEQRNNIRLYVGEHYRDSLLGLGGLDSSSASYRFFDGDYGDEEEKRIALTWNYMNYLCGDLIGHIHSVAPWVVITPNNDDEEEDRKAAELHGAVWEDAKNKYNLTREVKDWMQDFVVSGEVVLKIIWNPEKGHPIAMEQRKKKNGEFEKDEYGNPVPSETAIMSGDFEFKRILPSNLLRPGGCTNMQEAEWLMERDYVKTSIVRNWLRDEPSKLRMLSDSDSEDFTYDYNDNRYGKSKKGETLVVTKYVRPCAEHPKGYYCMFTKDILLFQGELPFGIFPVVYGGFDSKMSSPRHNSPLKQYKHYQIEINRCVSAMAEHQATIGDDKVYMQNGSMAEGGVRHHGVRFFNISGEPPTVVAGRSGDQYLGYLNQVLQSLMTIHKRTYSLDDDKTMGSGGDGIMPLLFASARQKARYSFFVEKFEDFLINVCMTFLKLAKEYYDEYNYLKATGKNELVNIQEYKDAKPLGFKITAEPRSADYESIYGRQVVYNHLIQYAGKDLGPEYLGKLIQNMPFVNVKDSFSSLTLNEKAADNMILALDRGEYPHIGVYDEVRYLLKRLAARTTEASFDYLTDGAKSNYQAIIKECEALESDRMQKQKALESEQIPMTGPGIKLDLYVKKDGKDPTASKKLVLPEDSVKWLLDKLEKQNADLEGLDFQTEGVAAEIARLRAGAQLGADGAPKEGEVPRNPPAPPINVQNPSINPTIKPIDYK